LGKQQSPGTYDQEAITKWLRSEPASLPFAEVWEDLKRALKKKSEFETLTTRSSFSARLAEDQRGIVIEAKSKKSTVGYDLLLDFGSSFDATVTQGAALRQAALIRTFHI
jgi:K+-transporting ATPase c subunit